mgnify:CR=1 FL=1
MNPPKELCTYPMYIDNPQKVKGTITAYTEYTMDGTDITEQLKRRYSDFFKKYYKVIISKP